MYKLFRLNEYYYKYYGLLIDSESIEDQLEDIYMSLENILGESFSIIIDTFIRTGYNYNRFLLINYKNKKFDSSIIINSREIPEEIKKITEDYIKKNISILENSSLSIRTINIIKEQLGAISH